VNLLVGILAFLPFPGWQKLVAFLSSASILSYGIGPICLLAMRKLQPDTHRPFKLRNSLVLSHIAFYVCNLMLYWCGFSIIWKLDVALVLGLVTYLAYHRKNVFTCDASLVWFWLYMGSLTGISYLGSFGGNGWLSFPMDTLCILPLSILMLQLSQRLIRGDCQGEPLGNLGELSMTK
jgi:amino acid transporter